jgi:hypothetical protein
MSMRVQPSSDVPVPELQQRDGAASPHAQPVSVDDPLRMGQLVLSVVRNGFHLDGAWRHAYLRNRWLGN